MSALKGFINQNIGTLSKVLSGILVFQYDGFELTGGIAKIINNQVIIDGEATSRAVELSAAIGAVLDTLKSGKEYKTRLPKHALLVTAGMVCTMMDLPVDPQRPRKDNEMKELVKWELEPLFTEQNDIWMIGAVLLGRGYITREQRQDIAVNLELATSATGGRRLTRFGELAVEMGIVTRQQLDECLLLQERLVMMDEDVECGWQAEIIQDPDGTERSSWLGTAIGKSTRQKWVKAFQNNKISLDWIYPANTSSLGQVMPLSQADGEKVILEIHQEQLVCVRANSRYVVASETQKRSGMELTADICVDVCHEQMRPGVGVIYLVGGTPELASGIAAKLDRQVIPINDKSVYINAVASHLYGVSAISLGVRVKARDPSPPIYKNVEILRMAAIGIVFGGIITTETLTRMDIIFKQSELARLDKEFNEKLKLNKQMQGLNNESRKLMRKVKDKQVEVSEISKKLAVINNILIDRLELVPGLLVALKSSISDEVVIDGMIEDRAKTNTFILAGWALTDTSAQLFVNNLNSNLARWGLMVVDDAVIRQSNAYGVDGYMVTLMILPRPPEELSDSSFTRKRGS